MSKARESFSQQLDEFERIAVEKIKEHGHDVFINETVEAIREALPGTRGTPARKDTRFSAHRIIHRIILQFSRYDVGMFGPVFHVYCWHPIAHNSFLGRSHLYSIRWTLYSK